MCELSPTKRLPCGSKEIPVGCENLAAVPMPSVTPRSSPPASVVTTFVKIEIARITGLANPSITYRVEADATRLPGKLNRAFVPMPSRYPDVPFHEPARNVMAPVFESTMRMLF